MRSDMAATIAWSTGAGVGHQAGMTLDLTFLGTGNAFAASRYWSSFLVNGRYLFDAPPTLLAHLKKLGKSPGDIEVVFISHFHADHFFGLPFLFLEYAELAPRSKDLTIIGPPGIAKRVESLTELGYSNVFRKRDRGYALKFIEAADGKTGEAAGCSFAARRVPHVAGPRVVRVSRRDARRTPSPTRATRRCATRWPRSPTAPMPSCASARAGAATTART